MTFPFDDPPVRDDSTCAVCRKPRPEIAVRNLDPFCRTECARDWHNPGAYKGRSWLVARAAYLKLHPPKRRRRRKRVRA